MTTASTRIWTFAAVVIVIVAIALGWFLGAAPKLAEAARFDDERRTTELQNDATRVVIAQLEQDFAQIEVLRAELDEVRARFPFMPEYDDAIEELLAGIVGDSLGLESVVVAEPVPDSPDTVIDENGQVAAGTLMRVPISINVQGDFLQALRLIERLQLSDRFGIVVSADYVDGRNEGERATVIQLVIFVLTDVPVSLGAPVGGDGAEPTPSPSPEPEPAETSTTEPTDPSAPPTPSP